MTTCLLVVVVSCSGISEKLSPSEQRGSASPSQAVPVVTGEVTLSFAGSIGRDVPLKAPWGISFGIDGTLYVCDRDNAGILRFDRAGNVISRFNGFDSRTERMFLPIDVSVSGGIEIYGLDGANSRVLRFDRNLRNAYAIYRPETDEKHRFGTFKGLAFDQISGDLFITDHDNGTVVRIDMFGRNIHTSGAFGSEKTSLEEPAGLDVNREGMLFIADTGHGAVGVYHHFGADLSFIGEDVLEAPVDTAVLPDNRIAVADKRGIVILSSSGNALGRAGFGVDRELSPRSVAYSEGKLYVSDALTASILVYRIENN